MNGGFQGMAMDQRAYASMIGQPPGYYGGGGSGLNGGGDRIMGGAMNRGSAVGAPLMMGAMGMMGLDPMSMGLKAGMGAFSGGAGIGGALGAGALAAAPIAAGMAVAGYAGNQFMNGAQGQMQLNQDLRSSFNFQNKQGGQGFTRSDSGQIGGMLRTMTEQFGAGGEVTSFKELSQLTAKMGQMGLAQGVKDVQEFGKKFKEMVSSLKVMAKDLGTTLEGAMEFANAAKGSGIFGISNAAKFASLARSTAISGGLSMNEVMGAANVGSQISRSVGGMGHHGAVAGANAIGQIGTALKMGVISEEDIYNVTGQTGAEGKQAYAASQLQKSANFLKSGHGRIMLASIAGKNGTLDQGAVQDLLSGGMDIAETRRRSQENLKKIGAADFIRNEGRLRGAAMEAIGTHGSTIGFMAWAQGKGIDINNMDDRSMVLAGRYLKMDREGVEQEVKMAQNLPSILSKERVSKENDLSAQSYAQQRKHMGIEGIKARFEQAKEHVNGKLQKVGQDIFNEGAEMVERFFNKLTGQYVQVMSEEADVAYRSAMGGGATGKKEFETYFGKTPSRLSAAGGPAKPSAPGSRLEAFNGMPAGGGALAMTGIPDLLGVLSPESSRSKYAKAGFKFGAIDALPIGKQDAALGARLLEIDQMATAAGTPAASDLVALGKGNAKWMNDFYASSLTGGGQDRIDAFGKKLQVEGDAPLRERWERANPVEKARIMSGLEVGAGIAKEARLAQVFKPPGDNPFATRGDATLGETHERYAEAFLGKGGGRGSAIGAGLGALVGTVFGPGIGSVVGATVGGALGDTLLGNKNERLAVGAVMASDQFKRYTAGVFSSDERTRDEARQDVQKDLQSLATGSGDEITGRRIALQGLLASDEFQRSGGTDKDADAILEKYKAFGDATGSGTGSERLKRGLGGLAASYSDQQEKITLGQARRRKAVGGAEAEKLSNLGIATFDNGKVRLTETTEAALLNMPGGEAVLQAALGATAKEAALSTTDAGAAEAGMRGAVGNWQDAGAALSKMSVANQRSFARAFAGSEIGEQASAHAAVQGNLTNMEKKKGAFAAAGSGLGVSISQAERNAFGGNLEKESALIIKKMGLGEAGEETKSQLTKYLGSVHDKRFGDATDDLASLKDTKGYKDAEKKQRDESAEQKDPFGKKQVDLLTALLKSSDRGKEELEKMNNKKDPEAPATP